MAKIFLVPYHPNEREVADYLAEKLRADLSKRGHQVEIMPVPERINMFGLAKKAQERGAKILKDKSTHEFDLHPLERPPTAFVKGLQRKNPNSFIVEVHTTPFDQTSVFHHPIRKTSKLKVRKLGVGPEMGNKGLRIADLHSWISLWPELSRPNSHLISVELRTAYKPTPPEIRALANTLHRIDQKSRYFQHQADLKVTLGLNYLTPRIIQRIGHAINTEVRTTTGEFHKPRDIPYKRKNELWALRERRKKLRRRT